MNKQEQVAADIPKIFIVISKPEVDPTRLSFKALLERFYQQNAVPVSDRDA